MIWSFDYSPPANIYLIEGDYAVYITYDNNQTVNKWKLELYQSDSNGNYTVLVSQNYYTYFIESKQEAEKLIANIFYNVQ